MVPPVLLIQPGFGVDIFDNPNLDSAQGDGKTPLTMNY